MKDGENIYTENYNTLWRRTKRGLNIHELENRYSKDVNFPETNPKSVCLAQKSQRVLLCVHTCVHVCV
jgi:hypothetical protein